MQHSSVRSFLINLRLNPRATGPRPDRFTAKRQLFKARVALLQPLIPHKGATGLMYSRHALARLFKVPYHMLKRESAPSPSPDLLGRLSGALLSRSASDISQTSLCELAHLSLKERCVVMNTKNPSANWTVSSLRAEYKRRGITLKKIRARYGYRKAS